MADSNLTIGIRADASQLRADLAIAQAEVRRLGTDLRNAANEAQKTGNTSGVRALADSFELARGKVTALRTELAAVGGGPGGGAAGAFTNIGSAASGLLGQLGPLGQAIGAMTTGLGGLATAMTVAVGGMFELAKSAAESTRELENQATTLGLTVDQLEAYKFAFGQAGVSAEATDKGLNRFVAKLGEAAEAQKKATDSLGDSANAAEKLRMEIKNLEIGVATARQATDNGRIATQQASDALAKGKVTTVEAAIAYQGLQKSAGAAATTQLEMQKAANATKAATTAASAEALKLSQSYQNQGVNAQKLALAEDALRLKQNEVVKVSTENVNAFTKLGIAATDAQGNVRDTREALDDFIKKVSELKSAGEQAVVLKEMFGVKGFAAIAPGIRLGIVELEKLRTEFEHFDVSPTAFESGLAKSFNSAFGKLATVFDGLKQAAGNVFTQLFTPAMTALANVLADNKENVRAFAQTLVDVLGPAFRLVGRLISGILKPIGDLFEVFGQNTGTVVAIGAAILLLSTRIGQIIAIVVVAEKALRLLFGDESTARIIAWGIEIIAAVKVLGMLSVAFNALNLAALPWIALGAAIAAVGVALLLLFGPVEQISKFIHENFGDTLGNVFDSFAAGFQRAVESIGEWMHTKFDELKQYLLDTFQSAVQRIIDFFQPLITLFDTLKQMVSDITGGAGAATAAASGASAAPGLARGGTVRGPSGRDRVPAWLTAGEFVHQLAAVRYYGVDFMHRINTLQIPKFDLGGMVGGFVDHFNPGTQSFAAGGMVAAASGGGRSGFTLVLDGRSYDAHSDAQTVESLARAARRREIASGGRKPSSFV